MPTIESKLQEYQIAVGRHVDQQRAYEAAARECMRKADLIRERIAGIQEAMELLKDDASNTTDASSGNPTVNVRRRQRSLTEHWQQIMQLVDGEGGFDYDALAGAVEMVGHDANRDTLRSQMSIYKGNGLVEAFGEGRFKLTEAGRRAARIEAQSFEDESSNQIGAAEAAPRARPDANPA